MLLCAKYHYTDVKTNRCLRNYNIDIETDWIIAKLQGGNSVDTALLLQYDLQLSSIWRVVLPGDTTSVDYSVTRPIWILKAIDSKGTVVMCPWPSATFLLVFTLSLPLECISLCTISSLWRFVARRISLEVFLRRRRCTRSFCVIARRRRWWL